MSLYTSVLLYLDHIHWFLLLCHYTLFYYFILIIFASFCYCVIIHFCLTLSWSHSLVFVIVSLYISVLLYLDHIHWFLLLCHYTLLSYFILITFTGFVIVSLYISVLLYLDHIHWFLLLCHYTLLSYFILITFTGFCYCVIIHYCLTLSWSHSLVFVIVSLYITVLLYLDHNH